MLSWPLVTRFQESITKSLWSCFLSVWWPCIPLRFSRKNASISTIWSILFSENGKTSALQITPKWIQWCSTGIWLFSDGLILPLPTIMRAWWNSSCKPKLLIGKFSGMFSKCTSNNAKSYILLHFTSGGSYMIEISKIIAGLAISKSERWSNKKSEILQFRLKISKTAFLCFMILLKGGLFGQFQIKKNLGLNLMRLVITLTHSIN